MRLRYSLHCVQVRLVAPCENHINTEHSVAKREGNGKFHSHGGCLSSTIVAEEGCDLVLVKVNGQAIYSQLVPSLVDLDEVPDGDPRPHIGWWFLQVSFMNTTENAGWFISLRNKNAVCRIIQPLTTLSSRILQQVRVIWGFFGGSTPIQWSKGEIPWFWNPIFSCDQHFTKVWLQKNCILQHRYFSSSSLTLTSVGKKKTLLPGNTFSMYQVNVQYKTASKSIIMMDRRNVKRSPSSGLLCMLCHWMPMPCSSYLVKLSQPKPKDTQDSTLWGTQKREHPKIYVFDQLSLVVASLS